MSFVKTLVLTTFLVVFAVPTSAEEIYVKVVKQKNKNNFNYVYNVLNRAGMNMFIKRSRENRTYMYTVYSGPYKTRNSAQKAYTYTKRYFREARLVRFGSKKTTRENSSTAITNRQKTNSGNFFAGAGLGYGSAPSTHVVQNGSVSIKQPNDTGMNYAAFLGYNFSKYMTGVLNIEFLNLDDLTLNNVYGSLNYNFLTSKEFSPYVGVSLGVSGLKWSNPPLDNANETSNSDSESIIYGTQAGLRYNGFYPFTYELLYKCMFTNHTTNITQDTTNRSQLEHNTLHSIGFSLLYNFN